MESRDDFSENIGSQGIAHITALSPPGIVSILGLLPTSNTSLPDSDLEYTPPTLDHILQLSPSADLPQQSGWVSPPNSPPHLWDILGESPADASRELQQLPLPLLTPATHLHPLPEQLHSPLDRAFSATGPLQAHESGGHLQPRISSPILEDVLGLSPIAEFPEQHSRPSTSPLYLKTLLNLPSLSSHSSDGDNYYLSPPLLNTLLGISPVHDPQQNILSSASPQGACQSNDNSPRHVRVEDCPSPFFLSSILFSETAGA